MSIGGSYSGHVSAAARLVEGSLLEVEGKS